MTNGILKWVVVGLIVALITNGAVMWKQQIILTNDLEHLASDVEDMKRALGIRYEPHL